MNKSHVPLKEIISTDVVSIDPHDTLRDALSVMVENHVSALPVVIRDALHRCDLRYRFARHDERFER